MDTDIDMTVDELTTVKCFSIGNIKTFTLGPNGLVENETIVKESSIKISFSIDNEKIHKFLNSDILNFEIILSCSNKSFLNSYISSPTVIINDVETSATSKFNDAELVSDISYTISNTGISEANATYIVTDKADTNNKYMADLYYSSMPTFNFKVRGKWYG